MIRTLYEVFQHWSERGSVFILSDLHLNDDDCLLMDPDWIPPEEQIWIINIVNDIDFYLISQNLNEHNERRVSLGFERTE